MSYDGISIIICCYNARERIIPTLQALQRQVDPGFPWELIVVDNASSDDTSGQARKTWEEEPLAPLTIVKEEKAGLIHARHKGLETARYEIVSFIDDDNRVEDHWVKKVGEVFSMDPSIGACGGRSIATFEKAEPAWFPSYQHQFAVGRQAPASGYVEETKGFLWGAGLSFLRSPWKRMREAGYQNLTTGRQGKNMMAGEDSELCYAFRLMGYRLYYRDDLVLHHYMPEGRMNFPYVLKMNFGFGLSHARLNCYKALLDPGFQWRPWWKEWLATWKNIGLLRIQLLFSSVKKEERQVRLAYYAGYARQLWVDQDKLEGYSTQLKKTFTALERQA